MPVEGAKRENLPDLQNEKDLRNKHIERAGVARVQIPLKVSRKDNTDGIPQYVQAMVWMYTSIGPEHKGANMSRFLETLMEYENVQLTSKSLKQIIEDMLGRLGSGSTDGYMKISFKYFLPKYAPVSHKRGVQGYDVSFIGRMKDGVYDWGIEVDAVGTNCCPCSKEISSPKIGGRGGAHNQRNHIKVRLTPNDNLFWIEDIIDVIEKQFSCPIYPLLKREDEKWVTEMAYENPKFVEDLARDVAVALDELGVARYKISSTADESIHHHEAEAIVSKDWILG